jgi:hypothetical protein
VLAGLREIDPEADLLYMGPRQWLLCTVRPSDMEERRTGEAKGEGYPGRHVVARNMVLRWQAVNPLKGNFSKEIVERNSMMRFQKVRLGQLALLGLRTLHIYPVNDPTFAIVEDFRYSQWKFLHNSDQDLEEEIDAPQEAARANARKDLADSERASAAWRYAFTLQHNPTARDVTQLDRDGVFTRSGFKRVRSIGNNGAIAA